MLLMNVSANHAFSKPFNLDKRNFLATFCERFKCPETIARTIGENPDMKRNWLNNLNWEDQFNFI